MSKFRSRSLALIALVLTVVSVIAGCGGSGSTTKKVELKAGEKVKVVFWHAMGGNLGEQVQKLVDKFNSSQDKVFVEASNQGTYDEALQKFKAAGPNGPTMIQVYEIGSRFMIDSGLVVPMQHFIDADKFDTKDFEENILGYYKFDGKLYSMPFNTSTPIMYYNKTVFKAAGLDPNKPPKTFEEFADVAKKLTRKSGNDVSLYGAGIAWYGWFYEQLLAVQGAHIVDNDNGRKAKATKALVDSKEGQNIVNWLKGMVDSGAAVNLGRKTSETQAAFMAGKIAMTFDSTAVVTRIVNGAGHKFEVGTAFLPRPANANGGVIIGGGSLWITNLHADKQQWAAWEFAKWLAQPEQQAQWHIGTGYFPITKATYNVPAVKEAHTKMPQFVTAIEQLRASKLNAATQGGVMGVFPQARQVVEAAMENVILGKQSTADALKAANAEITKGLENYNKTTK